jgi:trigger factor
LEVTINTLSAVQREADFWLSDSDLQPHFEKAYKKHAPKIEIKGFRKGKVPMPMIKKMYGGAIEQEALDEIANESFRATMEERSIEPIGRPALVDMDFKRGEHFRFKIKYEVKPTIELKQYKGLRVEKLIHNVTDKGVDAEVQRLRRVESSLLGVTLVRDDEDHIITADVQELADDGMPLIGKKSKDAKFSLHDDTLIPEIRDTLRKAEVGETYRVRFATKHDDHEHKQHLAISVKKIEKVELPDFDDAFVKKVTKDKVSTKEEFLANMRKDLEAYWVEQSERQVQDALVNEVVKSHDFEIPDALVNLYVESYLEDIKNRSKDQKLPQGFETKKFYEANKEYARQQAKWGLLRGQIIERENLKVTDEELEQLAEKEAATLGMEKEMLLKYYKSHPGATERMLSEKLMKMLRENAEISERVVEA